MQSRIETSPDSTRLVIEGTITEDDLEPLRLMLGAEEPDTIDTSDVRQIDLYGLQILISALRTAQAAGRPLTLITGRAIDKLSKRAGLEAFFPERSERSKA